jgi:hypothetical protein
LASRELTFLSIDDVGGRVTTRRPHHPFVYNLAAIEDSGAQICAFGWMTAELSAWNRILNNPLNSARQS